MAATLEQLEQALVAADAAGNVDDATALASEIVSRRGEAPQSGIREIERSKPLSGAGEFLKQSALPTIGAIGGGIAGFATPIPGGATVGEALGSGLGEYANQQLGITPKSNTALGLSVLAPPALRGVAKGLQQIPRMLPGSSAALQEQAALEARQLPAKAIDVSTPSGPLYESLKQAGASPTKLAFPRTATAIKSLSDDELKALAGTQNDDLVARLAKMEKGVSEGLTFQEFDKTIKNLGKKISTTDDRDLKGAYKTVFKSLIQDVETMQPPVDVPLDLWKQARTMYRKEMARTEFADMIETTGIKKVGELLDQVNPNAIANWVKSPKQDFWRKSLEPGELNQINQALKEWASIPTVPVKRGAPIGSGRKLGMVGAGGAVGGYMGGGMGAAVGMLAADKGAELIARAMMSDPGRKALVKILRASGGKFGQEQASILGAFLAGGLGDQMPQ